MKCAVDIVIAIPSWSIYHRRYLTAISWPWLFNDDP